MDFDLSFGFTFMREVLHYVLSNIGLLPLGDITFHQWKVFIGSIQSLCDRESPILKESSTKLNFKLINTFIQQ